MAQIKNGLIKRKRRAPSDDFRYPHVHSIWRAGDLRTFEQIFEIIPKTVVSKDLGMHYHSFIHRLDNPRLINMDQIIVLSDLTGISLDGIYALIKEDILVREANRKPER